MDMRALIARPETQAGEHAEHAERPRAATAVVTWDRLALGATLAISAFLNFYALSREGYGNSYYAAAVKSMLQSWHNFFFVSFDPGGFVSVDKPPLGFWLQVASAKLFGFHGWSLVLPEALAGVLSVALLYHLVRRAFGPVAGLLAGLALAVTPVAVASNRSNIVDSLLVLAVLLGAWAVLRATETGQLRWLLLSVGLVGLGFNIKMLQAFLVVPAFFGLYLLGARLRWRTRLWHLVVAGLVLLVVSLSWATAVDLTPASARPYVGSSSDNSEYNLIFGYNGLERLIGHLGFGRGGISNAQTPSLTSAISNLTNPRGPGGFGENGTPGPQRLFNVQLGGQAGWLLPLALLGIVAVGWRARPRLSHEPRQQVLLWGLWLLTGATFFSVAGFFHSYYLVMIAPPIAALAGAGLVALWQDYRESHWRAWLLPAALLGVAAVQAHLLAPYPAYSRRLTPAIIGLAAVAALVLLATRFLPRIRLERVAVAAAALGVLGLLLAPTVWAAETAVQGGGGMTPVAGPRAQGGFRGGFAGFGGPPNGRAGTRTDGRRFPGAGEFGTAGYGTGAFSAPPVQAAPAAGGFAGGPDQQTNASLMQYLEAQQGNTKFLLAVQNANTAAPIILDTGKPVMALGGFLGSDPILTPATLATLVSNGTVRFFLLGAGRGFGGFGGGGGSTTSLESWVDNQCTVVPTSTWQPSGSSQVTGGFGGAQQLYDCGGAKTGS